MLVKDQTEVYQLGRNCSLLLLQHTSLGSVRQVQVSCGWGRGHQTLHWVFLFGIPFPVLRSERQLALGRFTSTGTRPKIFSVGCDAAHRREPLAEAW
eukprot:s337_g2.t1